MARSRRRRSSPNQAKHGEHYTERVFLEACALREAGVSIEEIERRLKGPTQRTLIRWFKRVDLVKITGRIDQEQVLRDLEVMTPNEVAEKHNCSRDYVYQLRWRSGTSRPRPNHTTVATDLKTATIPEVASKYQLSENTVRKIARRAQRRKETR